MRLDVWEKLEELKMQKQRWHFELIVTDGDREDLVNCLLNIAALIREDKNQGLDRNCAWSLNSTPGKEDGKSDRACTDGILNRSLCG